MTTFEDVKGALRAVGVQEEDIEFGIDYITVYNVHRLVHTLPEGLQPYAASQYTVDHATLLNINGKSEGYTQFKLALDRYISERMRLMALSKTFSWDMSSEEYHAYVRERTELRERICQEPQIVKWMELLEGME